MKYIVIYYYCCCCLFVGCIFSHIDKYQQHLEFSYGSSSKVEVHAPTVPVKRPSRWEEEEENYG